MVVLWRGGFRLCLQAIESLRRASLGMSMDVTVALQDEEVQTAAIAAVLSKVRTQTQYAWTREP